MPGDIPGSLGALTIIAAWEPGALMARFRATDCPLYLQEEFVPPYYGYQLSVETVYGHPAVLVRNNLRNPDVGSAYVLLSAGEGATLSMPAVVNSPGFDGVLIPTGAAPFTAANWDVWAQMINAWEAVVLAFKKKMILAFTGQSVDFDISGDNALADHIRWAEATMAFTSGGQTAISKEAMRFSYNSFWNGGTEEEYTDVSVIALGYPGVAGSGYSQLVMGPAGNLDAVVQALEEISRMDIRFQAGSGGDRLSFVGGSRGTLLGGEE